MSRTIYLKESQVKAVQDEILYGEFEKALMTFLRQITENPLNTVLPELISTGFGMTSDEFIEELIVSNLLNREEKISDENGVHGQMVIVYTIPKSNYVNKIKPHELWAKLVSKAKVNEACTCCGCGSMYYYGPVSFDYDSDTKPQPKHKPRNFPQWH